MKLHVLGSAGYHPNGFRETTCLMIPELGIVLDAGTGFYRVRELLKDVPDGMPISVFISHAHNDHTIGLTYGINVFWGSGREVKVFGHEDHLRAVENDLFGGALFPLPANHPFVNYEFTRWTEGMKEASQTKSGICFETISLPHPGGSMGYRFSLPNGKSVAYITDTCADDVPVEFLSGVHTLIHECNFTDDLAELAKTSGHSTTSQVFRLARRVGVKRLVCMHWNTMLELEAGHFIHDMTGRDAAEELPFELILADDKTVIDL